MIHPAVFALRLFTGPTDIPAPSPASGEHFDTGRQVTVLADGTPRAASAFNTTYTHPCTGNAIGGTELETLEVIAAPAGGLAW